jgi:hypothetical protein
MPVVLLLQGQMYVAPLETPKAGWDEDDLLKALYG